MAEGDYPIGGGRVLPTSPIADKPPSSPAPPGTSTSGKFIDAYGQPYEIWVDANKGQTKNKGKNAEASQKQVGGPGTLIPIRYGEHRVGARISDVVVYQGNLVLRCVWGEGEIDAVEAIYINDDTPGSGVTSTHYLGTASQTADPTFVAAYAAQGLTYTDTLPNIAYSVIKVPPKKNTGFPEITAKIRGIKVATSDGGTPTYSRCPAYIIADFITNTRYGMRSQVDWSSVADVAAWNNETIGGQTRNLLDIGVDEHSPAEDWLLTLCSYASAIPVKLGSTYFLYPDTPNATSDAIDATHIVEDTLRWKKRGPRDAPNKVEVRFTNTSTTPWKEDSAFAYGVGVEEGSVEEVGRRVSKPAIHRYSEAYRYALQELNNYTTSDLELMFDVFDIGLAWTPGDRKKLTFGPFTDKELRIVSVMPRGGKLYSIVAVEYDAARWSDTVATGPSSPDTTLPSPQTVPTPTDLAVAEDVFQIQTGRFASRLRITWTGPTLTSYIYLEGYLLLITDGVNESSYELPFDALEFTTAALPENTNYSIFLRAKSRFAVSDAATTSIVNNGKLALPSDVPSVTAYSVNGETRIQWESGVDLDLTSHELRWSGQSGTWEDATHLRLVAAPTLHHTTTQIPAGARRVWVKARDSVSTEDFPEGQESLNATYVDLTVYPNNTSSSEDFALALGSLTNMAPHIPSGWVTAFAADDWDSTFPAAMSTYTDPLATYHTSGTSGLVSDTVDTGVSELCTVSLDGLDYVNLSGTARVYIEHKVLVGDAWTSVDGETAVVTARYFRLGIEWLTTETGAVLALGLIRKTVDATDTFVKVTVLNDSMGWMM